MQPWNRTFAGRLERLGIDSAVLRRENPRRSVDAPDLRLHAAGLRRRTRSTLRVVRGKPVPELTRHLDDVWARWLERVRLELLDAGHRSVGYRYPRSLSFLVRALAEE